MPLWIVILISLSCLFPSPALAAWAVAETTVQVQVQGAVQRPGLYRLPVGSRVAELLARAGGPRRDAQLRGLALARRVQDGELVTVPTQQEARQAVLQAQAAQAAPAPAHSRRRRHATRTAAPAGVVDLNTASAALLDTLPGIGPGLAATIIQERQKRGRFKSVEDLREIAGIGKKRFERLRKHLTVS